MKTVPLRDFILHSTDVLKDLPVALTRYGQTVCVVLPYKEYAVAPGENVSTVQVVETVQKDAKVLTDVLTHETRPVMPTQNRNFCRFCGNRGASLHRYQYEDGSGEGEAFFCDSCWRKYEEAHQSHIGGYTTVRIPSDVTRANEFRGSFPKPVKKKKGT